MIYRTAKPRWEREGPSWPHHRHSRFVAVDGLTWHIQTLGPGSSEGALQRPLVVLIHGTGASSHSWRDTAQALAAEVDVLMVDLPGHGFSATPDVSSDLSLTAMGKGLARLFEVLDVIPAVLVGHSAGAAVAIRSWHAAASGRRAVHIISVNGALMPFKGMASQIYSPLAKMVALNPFLPAFAAWRAQSDGSVERLMRQTGSRIPDEGVTYYRRLFAYPGHISATMAMMAVWELDPIRQDLRRLGCAVTLLVGARDQMVPPSDSHAASELAGNAELISMPAYGHLLHEEAPESVAGLIMEKLQPLRN